MMCLHHHDVNFPDTGVNRCEIVDESCKYPRQSGKHPVKTSIEPFYMELHIQNETAVKDIQRAFTECYPFLKLQFSSRIDTSNEPVQRVKKSGHYYLVKQYTRLVEPHFITIHSTTTVARLLGAFKAIGLMAQISRKWGNLWIETTLTEDWTLERQNKEAFLLNDNK